MIIFLYGPDAYRRVQKKKSIIAEFSKKHSPSGIRHFDFGEKQAAEKFCKISRIQSIFNPMSLAVLESVFEEATEDFSEMLKDISALPNLTVLLSETGPAPKAFSFLTRKPVLSEKFAVQSGDEWAGFIMRELRNKNLKLTKDALILLSEAYKGDSWRLVTELEKLQSLGKLLIERSDLDDLDIELNPSFWGLVQNFKNGRESVRLGALAAFDSRKDIPAKVFNILASMCPGRVREFACADKAIKSGKLGYEEALLDLAL